MKVKRIVPPILCALLWAACSSGGNGREVRLRMEIGYPMFGNVAGGFRIWPLCRIPAAVLGALSAGDEVAVALECHETRCSVTHTELLSVASGNAQQLAGRVLSRDNVSGEALLILDPFPVAVRRSFVEFSVIFALPRPTGSLTGPY